MNNYTVYIHISPSNKRYIGITRQKEKERWQNGKGYEHNKYFTNAIKKYGWNNFQHIIIARGLDEETAKWLEIELIREWDTTNKDKGYNLTKGGESSNGLVHTEEFKEKRSEKYRGEGNPFYGKQHSEETKEKLREINTGKTLSEETKRKISENHRDVSGENNPNYGLHEEHPFYGKQHSEETKEKQSKARIGKYCKGENPNAKKIICLETMEIFNSIIEASEFVNGCSDSLSICIKKEKKYKNYSFMLYEDYIKNGEKEIRNNKSGKGKDNSNAKKIICLETMEIFDTQKDASVFAKGNTSSLGKAIKNKKKYKGYTFMLYKDYILSMEM